MRFSVEPHQLVGEYAHAGGSTWWSYDMSHESPDRALRLQLMFNNRYEVQVDSSQGGGFGSPAGA